MHIRRAKKEDLSRIAEILVYNNRVNYFPIFGSEEYSFKELQVLPLAEEYEKRLPACLVYDDGILRGFIETAGAEVKKLYTDVFFQGRGVGAALLEYAVRERGAAFSGRWRRIPEPSAFTKSRGFSPAEIGSWRRAQRNTLSGSNGNNSKTAMFSNSPEQKTCLII